MRLLALASAVGLALLGVGCSTAPKTPEVSKSGFQADPSKMTAQDKANMEKLMKSGGAPPPGTPASR